MDTYKGTLRVVPEGHKRVLKIEFTKKGKTIKAGISAEIQLDRELQSKPLEELNDIEVQFELDRNGTPVRIRASGMQWSNPKPIEWNTTTATDERVASFNYGSNGKVEKLRTTRGNEYESRRIDICEIEAAEQAKVEVSSEADNKLIRSDYNRYRGYIHGDDCYPFNFVRAPRTPPPKTCTAANAENIPNPLKVLEQHPEMDFSRFADKSYTGTLYVELTFLSPAIVSHPPSSDTRLSKIEQDQISQVYQDALSGSKYGPTRIDNSNQTMEQRRQRIRPFAQSAPARYVIPATTLKGVIRSMVEAYSHSFMGVISESLKGDKDEGDAKMRHRKGRATKRGIPLQNVTLYTYEWAGRKGAGDWNRWVLKGNTPWDKLNHLSAEQNANDFSLACRMFGRVAGDDKHLSWAGRVRVSQAVGWDADGNSTVRSADGFWFLKTLTRPSGAKAKCEALYLIPDANPTRNVSHYDDANSEARGRKMYWPHSLGGPGQPNAISLAEARDIIAKSPNPESVWDNPKLSKALEAFRDRVKGHPKSHADSKSWVKPLLPGSRFRFQIRFTNLTSVELGALVKSLTLENPNNGDLAHARHCHRIGRAKPLGFGSAVLTVKSIDLLNVKGSYALLGPMQWLDTPKAQSTQCDALTDFEKYCAAWKAQVWDDIAKLTAIPDKITDYDYWKNWSDFNPLKNQNYPLPLP